MTAVRKILHISATAVEEIKQRESSELYFVLLGAIRARGHEEQKPNPTTCPFRIWIWIVRGFCLFFSVHSFFMKNGEEARLLNRKVLTIGN